MKKFDDPKEYLPVLATGVVNIQRNSKILLDTVSFLDMEDIMVANYARKIKKLVMQSMDICNEINRQSIFLGNAGKTALLNKKIEFANKEIRKRKIIAQTEEEVYGN